MPHRRLVQQAGWLFAADHDAAAALHHVKHGADDAGIVAEEMRRGSEREYGIERVEPAMLARHVVRRGWNRAEGRPPQHQFAGAEANQIGQVRVSAGELLDFHRAREIETGKRRRSEPLAKVGLEARPVERLSNRARPYRDDTLTFTIAVVQQQTNPPPPSPE